MRILNLVPRAFSVFKMAAENGEDPEDEVVRILLKGELFSDLLEIPPKYINMIYEFGLVRQKHDVWTAAGPESCSTTSSSI